MTAIIPALPLTLTNGTTADATQEMSLFNYIMANVNASGAHSGANTDITSLGGLTTPLSVGQGGSGTNSLGQLFLNLMATGQVVPIANGGTNSNTQAGALSNILGGVALSIANGGTGQNNAAQAIAALLGGTSGTIQLANLSPSYSLSNPGYIQFGGLILNWGTLALSDGAYYGFSKAFNSQAYTLQITPGANGGTIVPVGFQSLSVNGFVPHLATSSNGTSFSYLAVGY